MNLVRLFVLNPTMSHATMDDVKTVKSITVNSIYYDPGLRDRIGLPSFQAAMLRVLACPNIAIGSYDPHELFTTSQRSPVFAVGKLVGEDFPILTEGLIEQIYTTVQNPDLKRFIVYDAETIKQCLIQHLGYRVFILT